MCDCSLIKNYKVNIVARTTVVAEDEIWYCVLLIYSIAIRTYTGPYTGFSKGGGSDCGAGQSLMRGSGGAPPRR